MIKNNELRRGNRVFHNREIVEVESLNDEGINLQTPVYDDYDASPEYYYHNLDPIPLSPEVLEACGFELITWNGVIKQFFKGITENNRCVLSFKFGEFRGFENRLDSVTIGTPPHESGSTFGRFNITHLHQLQNLYYSLTGSELQVNLTTKV